MATIRPEQPEDVDAVRRVHQAAFPTAEESALVDQLRAVAKALISLVAETDGTVVGHILFSPVTVDSDAGLFNGVGLAPLAVLPSHQNQGIGSKLVQEGLAACRRMGFPFVVVLGHANYYPRFGFRRASEFNLGNEYGAGDSFQVQELQSGSLPAGDGLVRYGPEFAEFAQ